MEQKTTDTTQNPILSVSSQDNNINQLATDEQGNAPISVQNATDSIDVYEDAEEEEEEDKKYLLSIQYQNCSVCPSVKETVNIKELKKIFKSNMTRYPEKFSLLGESPSGDYSVHLKSKQKTLADYINQLKISRNNYIRICVQEKNNAAGVGLNNKEEENEKVRTK